MKALIVVDIQNWIMSKALYNKVSFLSVINKAIDIFRSRNDLIVFVQHNNKKLVAFTEDWELYPELHKENDDIIIQKEHGDAFENTTLTGILRKREISEVCICGLVSHGCIKSTCEGGLNNGFIVELLENGHTNWNKNSKELIVKVNKEMKEKGIRNISI